MSLREHRTRVTHDRWLVSYADFITLLFAFFVVLFAASKADQKKQLLVSRSIDSAFRSFGVLAAAKPATDEISEAAAATGEPQKGLSRDMRAGLVLPGKVKEDLNQVRRELEKELSEQIAGGAVSIGMGHDGLVISLREAGFFESGSAAPRQDSLATLRQIAGSLGKTAYDVRVEGHTDNVPIHSSQFDSNWELSAARATRIARIFLEQKAIPPDRISAAGYAEFHPVANNASAEGRALNRRVDLVVLPRSSIDLSTKPKTVDERPWKKITDAN